MATRGGGAAAPPLAQGVVDQVAQRQAQPHRVQLHGGQRRRQVELQRRAGEVFADQFAYQRIDIDALSLQRSIAGGQAFAFQQVGDQVAHRAQVAQQRVALRARRHQLGIQPRARQRRAQLVAHRQQQAATRFEHGVQVARHGVDLRGQLAQFVLPPHGDGRVKAPLAKTQGTGADVVQRPEQVAHIGVGRGRQQQQRGQRHPADAARARCPAALAQAKDDAVAIGAAPLQQPARVVIVFRATMPAAALRVRIPLHRGAFDAHRQRQALHQRLGARRVGRRADLGGQPVDVVGDQRAQHRAPAGGQRALHAGNEDGRGRQRQHQKQQHQAHAQRAPQPLAPAHLRHARAPAKAYPALRSVLMQSSGSSLRRSRLTRMSTARVCSSAS